MKKLLKDSVFFFLYYLTGLLRRKKSEAPKDVRSIVFISWQLIGDTFLALPVLHATKQKYPAAKITVVSKPFTASLYSPAAGVDEVIILEENEVTGPNIKKLMAGDYDVVVDLTNNLKSFLFVLLTKGKYKIGGSGSYNLLGIRYEGFRHLFDKMLPPPADEYVTDYFFNIVRLFDEQLVKDREWVYPVVQAADTIMLTERRTKIGICIGASRIENLWEMKNWVTLINTLASDKGLAIYIFGGKSEKKFLPELEPCFGQNVFPLIGSTTLDEAVFYLSQMDYLISNDTGLMHVAIHYSVPTVCLSGPTKAKNYVPDAPERIRVIQSKLWCQPCYSFLHLAEHYLHDDCTKNAPLCRRLLTVEQVLNAFNELRKLREIKPRAADDNQGGIQ